MEKSTAEAKEGNRFSVPIHYAAEVRPFFTNQAKELDELLARIYLEEQVLAAISERVFDKPSEQAEWAGQLCLSYKPSEQAESAGQ
eukprot:g81601.t1